VSPVQVWLVVAIPTLLLGLALFLRRSPLRAMLGYAVLAVGFGVTSYYHRPSGAVFGGLLALLYAAGRGGALERQGSHPDEEGVPDAALHPFRRQHETSESGGETEVKAS
jgi:hypothetical protein